MGFDPEVVFDRLAVLEENLRLLQPFAELDLTTYLGDPRNYGAAEFAGGGTGSWEKGYL